MEIYLKEFHDDLISRNCYKLNVAKDGNCFFLALCRCLYEKNCLPLSYSRNRSTVMGVINQFENAARQARNNVVNYMRTNITDYSVTQDYNTFNKYCNTMAKNGTFCSEQEIKASANYYQVAITCTCISPNGLHRYIHQYESPRTHIELVLYNSHYQCIMEFSVQETLHISIDKSENLHGNVDNSTAYGKKTNSIAAIHKWKTTSGNTVGHNKGTDSATVIPKYILPSYKPEKNVTVQTQAIVNMAKLIPELKFIIKHNGETEMCLQCGEKLDPIDWLCSDNTSLDKLFMDAECCVHHLGYTCSNPSRYSRTITQKLCILCNNAISDKLDIKFSLYAFS